MKKSAPGPIRFVAGIVAGILALGLAPDAPAEELVGGCSDFRSIGNAYFGDLHVHTNNSYDGYGFGTPNDPAAAYAAAAATLDFAAVTDHADYLGETRICATPGSPGYDTVQCQNLRAGQISAGELRQLCRADEPAIDPVLCADALALVWTEIQDITNGANQPCDFTTFVAYEYSLTQGGTPRHRNVVFASENVPDRPFDHLDYETPVELWEALRQACVDLPDCGVVAIPHTSNASFGEMFSTLGEDGNPLTLAEGELRAALEPLVEVFQHKGNSECYEGVGNVDEECGFEQVRDERLIPPGETEVPRLSFAREGLKEGLRLSETLGVNPFAFGLVGGTDTHNGLPGDTDETSFTGHTATRDDEPAERLGAPSKRLFNPGGLMGVWAQENTRPAIFRALRFREVFATSGTRLLVRFFGGWNYSPALCSSPNPVVAAYLSGVPMGGVLRERTDVAPEFLVIGQRDPASAGVARLQIVKGWYDGVEVRESVLDVLDSGSPGGSALLCAVWSDPAFDPSQPAFYYARVLEAPTERWSTLDCTASGVDCANPGSVPAGMTACCDGSLPETIQERAWSSPVWYQPQPAGG